MRKRLVVAVIAVVVLMLSTALAVWGANASGCLVDISGEVQYTGAYSGFPTRVVALKDGAGDPVDVIDLYGDPPWNFAFGCLPCPSEGYELCAQIDLDNSGGPPDPGEPDGCTWVEVTQGNVTGVIVVMEDPAEEFVPEWGSIALMASGLMGLAGYTGLRLRNK